MTDSVTDRVGAAPQRPSWNCVDSERVLTSTGDAIVLDDTDRRGHHPFVYRDANSCGTFYLDRDARSARN